MRILHSCRRSQLAVFKDVFDALADSALGFAIFITLSGKPGVPSGKANTPAGVTQKAITRCADVGR